MRKLQANNINAEEFDKARHELSTDYKVNCLKFLYCYLEKQPDETWEVKAGPHPESIRQFREFMAQNTKADVPRNYILP